MRIAIVDDDAKERTVLKEYVERFEKERFGAESGTFDIELFDKAVDFVSDYRRAFDIILLDIEMPVLDGMSAARKLREVDENVVIIFITHMAEFAIKGYEVGALDFMIKPVSYANLSLKLDRALKIASRRRTVPVRTDGQTLILSVDDILYVEGLNQYVIYHTRADAYKVHGTLRDNEAKLGAGFSRCNNSFIVNLKHVNKIEPAAVVVGQDRISMSRSRKAAFLGDMNRYLGAM